MSETKLKLRIYGDRALRRKSLPVKSVGAQEKILLDSMAEIMYASGGIGLAAPQVGVNRQMIIVDVGKGLTALINPRIRKKKGSWVMQEGCLSVPEVYVDVKRAKRVFVEGLDVANNRVSFWADEIFGRALQHEIDHLRGKLIVDYASLVKRLAIRGKFKALPKTP